MKCIAFISPGVFIDSEEDIGGDYNGYVAVPPGHPYYQKDYCLGSPVNYLDVHGGITWADSVKIGDSPTFQAERYRGAEGWIGKRFPMVDNAEYITEGEYVPDDWWVLGFDTVHAGDTRALWPKERIIAETLHLKEQLESI